MKNSNVLLMSVLLSQLVACTSMSGLSGSSELSCPMPDGSTCKSMSQAYHDSFHKTPAMPSATTNSATTVSVEPTASKPKQPELAAEVGSPLLAGPRLMRIFIAPWTDADDDLMEGRRVYVKVEKSRWRLDHVKASLYRQFRPITPPPNDGAGTRKPAESPAIKAQPPLQAPLSSQSGDGTF